ncbi:MAG: ZIP family metal transporter [Candidatus Curtissbacteria bacterium]|nr:ZIP family metal transporter [Candidatus Curtissbacteria bacterium]
MKAFSVPTLIYILIFSFIGSVVSLTGGIFLLLREKTALKFSHLIASFAAGALLATAFFDLLPEASEVAGDSVDIFLWTLIGILSFFLLERFVHWFHHHHEHEDAGSKPTIPLIMVGDTVHNFIDGIAMGAAFLVSVPLGIVTALAVATHEIPQEVGDFGLMLHRGVTRKKIILFNIFSALAAMAGALLIYFVGDIVEGLLPIFLAVTAGFFIYIAASDIIPEIHSENRRGFAFYESLLLITGVVVVWVTIILLEPH